MAKLNYFQSFENYFWQWEEMGEVVCIPGGSTIAYKAFLKDVIPLVSVQGLPPFGALLLAIIATNPNGKQVLNELDSRITDEDGSMEITRGQAHAFLHLLASVPEEFKKGSKKIQLFQAIFEKCHAVCSQRTSQEAIRMLSGMGEWDKCLIPEPFNKHVLKKDLRVFSVLSFKLTSVQQILDKVAALPEIPDFIELLEPEASETTTAVPTDFIDELIANDRTNPVGTLIRHLWGGLNIPFHSALPSSQPLGGISDLTNKGDFDKLLISEFANDDLVFLSRLANNEALYIQREIPPQQNELERIILIDSSLKNWGTPKTVAFAIMLAIAKHPKTDIPCRSFVIGDGYVPINSDSVTSLIDALSILNAQLNAAQGFRSYLNDFRPNKQQEIFIVTEKSTLKQADMLKVINELHQEVTYWIYTDAIGNIDIYKKQQQSKRSVQHIKLPLEELWKKEAPKSKVTRKEFQGNYPILFHPGSKYHFLYAPQSNCFLISNDWKLFRFVEDLSEGNSTLSIKKGLDLIWNQVPSSCEYQVGVDVNNDLVLASVDTTSNNISLYNITTRKEQTAFFDKNSITRGGLHFHDNQFRYHSSKGNWIIDPITAEVKKDFSKTGITRADLKEARNRQSSQSPRMLTHRSVLKHINSIAISDQQNLIFNDHELKFNHTSGTIKITNRKDLKKVLEAAQSSTNEFAFADGSSIEVNQSGMLILKSSNPSIPVIFIPSVLETKLGVATNNAFSGDDFFKKTEGKSISTKEFFDRFMHPFLKNILSHGA